LRHARVLALDSPPFPSVPCALLALPAHSVKPTWLGYNNQANKQVRRWTLLFGHVCPMKKELLQWLL
jgi:hypothetical protein